MDGAVERSANLSAGKDLQEGAGQTAPLNAKENFESGPHHTPGPWQAWQEGTGEDGGPWHVRLADGDHITIGYRGLVPDEANARLIAAAPDLLVALRWISVSSSREAREAARAAIAKAEGRD